MAEYRLLFLPGDGIGPEIVAATKTVLQACIQRFQLDIQLEHATIGGAAIDAEGTPYPASTQAKVQQADAVLLGAVGGPKWTDPDCRPEQGLLALRKDMQVFANLRPVKPWPKLADASPLKSEYLQGVDLLVVRELTGGIYFGEKSRTPDSATDVSTYSRQEVERIVRKAFQWSRQRRKKVTMVDKANVLETSRLWREVTQQVHQAEYQDVHLEILLVDAAAMHLLSRPADFDVMVTENMFGDILTDEASMLAGSLGVLPSASLGDGPRGLYEPIHGSAPDIAGQNRANPIGTILSLALLFCHSLQREDISRAIEDAVDQAVETGQVTADLKPEQPLGCMEVGEVVAGRVVG